MSQEPFRARPRSTRSERDAHDLENTRGELTAIRERLRRRVIDSAADGFSDGSVAYDAACVAVIRFHALLERPENGWISEAMSVAEIRAVTAARNIVAHAGYRRMNDDLFWVTATVDLPAVLNRLLESP